MAPYITVTIKGTPQHIPTSANGYRLLVSTEPDQSVTIQSCKDTENVYHAPKLLVDQSHEQVDQLLKQARQVLNR